MDKRVRKTAEKIVLPLVQNLRQFVTEKELHKKFTNYIDSFKRVVVFSPHFDDVVLSAGTIVAYFVEKGFDITVLNFFTKPSDLMSYPIRDMLKQSKFSSAKSYFEARRKEDLEALKKLGVKKIVNLDFIDAQWRFDEQGQPLYHDCRLQTIKTQEKKYTAQIKIKIRKFKKLFDKSLIFIPLARGRHIDHLITREVGRSLTNKRIFYEDFPYSAHYDSEDHFVETNQLTSVRWFGNYKLKKQAILKYKTQLPALFKYGSMKLPLEKYYYSK